MGLCRRNSFLPSPLSSLLQTGFQAQAGSRASKHVGGMGCLPASASSPPLWCSFSLSSRGPSSVLPPTPHKACRPPSVAPPLWLKLHRGGTKLSSCDPSHFSLHPSGGALSAPLPLQPLNPGTRSSRGHSAGPNLPPGCDLLGDCQGSTGPLPTSSTTPARVDRVPWNGALPGFQELPLLDSSRPSCPFAARRIP